MMFLTFSILWVVLVTFAPDSNVTKMIPTGLGANNYYIGPSCHTCTEMVRSLPDCLQACSDNMGGELCVQITWVQRPQYPCVTYQAITTAVQHDGVDKPGSVSSYMKQFGTYVSGRSGENCNAGVQYNGSCLFWRPFSNRSDILYYIDTGAANIAECKDFVTNTKNTTLNSSAFSKLTIASNANFTCEMDPSHLRPGPSPPPPPPPPPSPLPPRPLWHLPARCEEGDVNALFKYNGNWHLMQQWALRPHTSVGHSVSSDLLHWRRVSDVLQSGAANNQQCYDGSASLVMLSNGTLSPFLMIDGGCGKYVEGNKPCMESAGNGSTGGVTAFPNDLNDPNLENWTVRGPTYFEGCDGSTGPSPIWKNGNTYNLIAIHGKGEARFVSLDESLTKWKMDDPAFLPSRGGGGGLWHELPPNVDGVYGGRWATHIFQADGVLGDGRATFEMGVYNATQETFTNITGIIPLDLSRNVAYGQLSHQKAYGTGENDENSFEDEDNRTIHVSWLSGDGTDSKNCYGGGQLTLLRDVRFDPRLGDKGALVENPVAEYYALRGALVSKGYMQLTAGAVPSSLLSDSNDTVLDVELNISLATMLSASENNLTVTVGMLCNPKTDNLSSSRDPTSCTNGVAVILTVSKVSTGGSLVTFMATSANQHSSVTSQFPVLSHESEIPLRIMSDTRSVEVFAGNGRAVFSTGSSILGTGIEISCVGENTMLQYSIWNMNSIN
eukprot:m.5391 g.5391  ORF g.5391 m.5391 type:complete len:723 (-) comp3294_c0_seq1:94-2262(-)